MLLSLTGTCIEHKKAMAHMPDILAARACDARRVFSQPDTISPDSTEVIEHRSNRPPVVGFSNYYLEFTNYSLDLTDHSTINNVRRIMLNWSYACSERRHAG